MNTKRILPWLLLACLVVAGLDAWPDPKNIQVPAGALLGWNDTLGRWVPVSVSTLGVLDSNVTLPTSTDTIGTVLDAALPAPTVADVNSASVSATVSNATKRAFIVFQNKHATASAFIYPGSVATPGFGIELPAGTSLTRGWDSTVVVSYASTETVPLCIDQEVQP